MRTGRQFFPAGRSTGAAAEHQPVNYLVWPCKGLLNSENTVPILALAAPLVVLALRSRWRRHWLGQVAFWLQALPMAYAACMIYWFLYRIGRPASGFFVGGTGLLLTVAAWCWDAVQQIRRGLFRWRYA